MRIVALFIGALLLVAVIAEGALLVKTRREVTTLRDEIVELRGFQEELASNAWGVPSTPRPVTRVLGGYSGTPAPPEANKLPPPKFVVPPGGTPGESPLPPALDTPYAREQLRAFVAEELNRDRDRDRDRNRQMRDQFEQQRIQDMTKALGLNEEETRRFGEVFAQTQTARRELRDKIQSGKLERTQIAQEVQSIRQKTEQQIKDVVGEERFAKLQQLERERPRVPSSWGSAPGAPMGAPQRGGPGSPAP